MTAGDVVYVVGKGRSGSTLLDQLLGNVSGWFSTGELSLLWDVGVIESVSCSCGRVISECPIWSRVVEQVGVARLDREAIVRWRRHAMSWPSVPRILAHKPDREARRYCDLMKEMYGAIREVSGAAVVVDSSKWPVNPGIERLISDVCPRVVHLVRDPRAVAHSWGRPKAYTNRPGVMPRHVAGKSAASWIARDMTCRAVRRRGSAESWTTVRYEDLVERPGHELGRIVAAVSERYVPALPLVEGSSVRIGESHMIRGNPSKGSGDRLALRSDDDWRRSIGRGAGLTVSAMCWPLMRSYGYRLDWRERALARP